jgi:hypothetical protein
MISRITTQIPQLFVTNLFPWEDILNANVTRWWEVVVYGFNLHVVRNMPRPDGQ